MVTESDFSGLGSFDDEEPPIWKPGKGDEIKGRVVERKVIKSSYGSRKALILETLKGLMTVVLGPAKLRRELAEDRDTQVGDLVMIRYEGEVTGASGGTFKDFKVLSSRKKQSSDWDAATVPVLDDDGFDEHSEPPEDPWDSARTPF